MQTRWTVPPWHPSHGPTLEACRSFAGQHLPYQVAVPLAAKPWPPQKLGHRDQVGWRDPYAPVANPHQNSALLLSSQAQSLSQSLSAFASACTSRNADVGLSEVRPYHVMSDGATYANQGSSSASISGGKRARRSARPSSWQRRRAARLLQAQALQNASGTASDIPRQHCLRKPLPSGR